MFYKITKDIFANLFGKCEPVALNDYGDLLQVKFNLNEIESKTIYQGFARLRKKYRNSEYKVIALFVYPGVLQVILGLEEEVSKFTKEDFMIEIC